MKFVKTLVAVLVFGLFSLGIAACGDDEESSTADVEAPTDLSGSITIDGSSTVQPFAEAAAELIAEGSPDLEVTVGAAGTSGGFEKFCAGEIDIADASRAIEPEEEDLCKEGGVEYSEIQVANDGVVVVTNPALEVSCLTTDQLAELWSDDKVTNLADLGEDAETGEPLPDAELSLYGPGTDSGTFDYFTEEINGEEGLSREDYQASEDDNVLVEGVTGDEAGIGYFGFSYYEQNIDDLNVVKIDSGDGCVEPTVDTIQSGEYAPLARPLYMYPSDVALGEPEVEGFMQFVVDDYEGIAEAALIVPMDETQAEEAQSNLESALGS